MDDSKRLPTSAGEFHKLATDYVAMPGKQLNVYLGGGVRSR